MQIKTLLSFNNKNFATHTRKFSNKIHKQFTHTYILTYQIYKIFYKQINKILKGHEKCQCSGYLRRL